MIASFNPIDIQPSTKQWTRAMAYADARVHLAEAQLAISEGRTTLARNHLRVATTRCSGWAATTMPADLGSGIANILLMLCDKVAAEHGYTPGYVISQLNKE